MPTYTDLARAFDALNQVGVIARHNFEDCQTCGNAAMDNEIKAERAAGRTPTGVTFYHEQDTERAIQDGVLYLCHSSAADEPTDDQGLASAALVVTTLKSNGFTIDWNGTMDERIKIAVDADSMAVAFPDIAEQEAEDWDEDDEDFEDEEDFDEGDK